LGKWTKHSDWQPLPKKVSESLKVCPICKQRADFEVHDRYGWTTRGYKIICTSCGAEWEYTTSKPKDLLFGGAFAAMHRTGKITNDDSIWVLKKYGTSGKGKQFLEKEINVSSWKQMSGLFCGICGKALAENEKFCPNCGEKTEQS